MKRLFTAFAFLYSFLVFGQVQEANLRKHIEKLTSEKLEGRGTSSKGEELAANYIAGEFKKYKLRPKGDKGTYLYHFQYKEQSSSPHGDEPENARQYNSKNVAGYLDNKAALTLVIGAHYDHLGLGKAGGSLDPEGKGKIHYGADDNASGVAGLLELARYYSTNKVNEPCNILFLAFSGEELGILGSKRYLEKPTVELSKVTCMINMDMIGRLNEEKRLIVSGTGTSPVFESLLAFYSNEELGVKTDSSGMGPSDHASFYMKDIPVLHFFTGTHSEYHKPTDKIELINFPGEQKVLGLIIQVSDSLMKLPKLEFLATRNKEMKSITKMKVTLGIMPDYLFDGGGVKVDGVTEGRPAEAGGIKKGDIILGMDDMPTESVQNYMKVLAKYDKGQTVKVKVKRGEEEMVFDIQF